MVLGPPWTERGTATDNNLQLKIYKISNYYFNKLIILIANLLGIVFNNIKLVDLTLNKFINENDYI